MAEIQYLKGDATNPVTKGRKIIAHICNDIGGWGKGFVLAISKKWKEPEAAYRKWYNSKITDDGIPFALGNVQIVPVTEYLSVANMIGQKGIYTGSNGPPIRYDAVESCLSKLADIAELIGASVHMPRIGCGLAGGQWEKVEPLTGKTPLASAVEVSVYDFE